MELFKTTISRHGDKTITFCGKDLPETGDPLPEYNPEDQLIFKGFQNAPLGTLPLGKKLFATPSMIKVFPAINDQGELRKSMILLFNSQYAIMVRPHNRRGQLFNISGGEHPEETSEECIRREVKEEVCLDVSNLKHMQELIQPSYEFGGHHWVCKYQIFTGRPKYLSPSLLPKPNQVFKMIKIDNPELSHIYVININRLDRAEEVLHISPLHFRLLRSAITLSKQKARL